MAVSAESVEEAGEFGNLEAKTTTIAGTATASSSC
jgi:hypothetical protein